jgi:RNA polymerase sigma-70 factor (ECF subfamily)
LAKISALSTDEQIMEAVKNGDLQQASILFERHHKRIYNFLARMALDRALAEDLTQNVFLRLIRYRTSYRNGNRFLPWIYQMARNVFADHYQTHKNRKADFVAVEHMGDTVMDHNDSAEQEERERILQRSLAQLSDEQRELLVLTRYQHMKYEEVAELMETSVANIKVKVHRAIAKLREHYFELEKNQS